MVAGLIEGVGIDQPLDRSRGALKLKRDNLQAPLDGDFSARHLFVLKHLHAHINALKLELAELDAYVLDAMKLYEWAHRLLQTIPGIDRIASALILIEISDDMTRFGCADGLAAWAAPGPSHVVMK